MRLIMAGDMEGAVHALWMQGTVGTKVQDQIPRGGLQVSKCEPTGLVQDHDGQHQRQSHLQRDHIVLALRRR